jgi:hypothetical protein
VIAKAADPGAAHAPDARADEPDSPQPVGVPTAAAATPGPDDWPQAQTAWPKPAAAPDRGRIWLLALACVAAVAGAVTLLPRFLS